MCPGFMLLYSICLYAKILIPFGDALERIQSLLKKYAIKIIACQANYMKITLQSKQTAHTWFGRFFPSVVSIFQGIVITSMLQNTLLR